MMRLLIAGLVVLLILPTSFAEEDYPLVEVLPIEYVGVDPDEARTIGDLVVAYASEIEGFRIVDPGTGALYSTRRIAGTAGAGPKYSLSGKLSRIDESFALVLELLSIPTGRKESLAALHPTMNALVLSLRDQVRSLFARVGGGAEAPAASPGEWSGRIGPATVAGTWKGDEGIVVRLFKDGTGIAQFPNGKTMKLAVEIAEDGTVIVLQNQPNQPEFYLKPPRIGYAIAKLIAEKARPMRWILRLDAAGKKLGGMKEGIAVVVSGGGELESIDNGFEKPVAWIKLP